MEGTNLTWRKSSFSSNGGGDCVEAASRNGTVMVRDTKQHGRGRVHTFTAGEWRAFLAGVKARPQADR
jgi:hypothetical protein